MLKHYQHAGAPVFREEQRFRQYWLWLVMILVVTCIWWTVISQMTAERSTAGVGEMPLAMLIIFVLVFGFGLPFLFFYAKLETEVYNDGIYVRLFPFQLSFRRITFAELDRAYARTYRPILEFGGWGIRGIGKSRAYNVSGNRGLQLEFKDGRRLLIGSQQPEEFAAAVQKYVEKK